MRHETINIGTNAEIIEMIETHPNKYRQAGDLSLTSQLSKIELTKGNTGVVFMLCDNPEEVGGFRIDKWWVHIRDDSHNKLELN